MTDVVKPGRRYESAVRGAQAAATRRAVLAAAREVFTKVGYVATTIEAIAIGAGVSPETVYARFRNKRSILEQLVDVTIAGDDAPVPVLARGWVEDFTSEPDARRALRILARTGRLILERVLPMYEVLAGAAAADPHAAAVLDRYRSQRFAAQRQLITMLTRRHPLRPGITNAAGADILFTIGSPETYAQLVRHRGWSPIRFERWYADTLARLLLPVDT